MNCPVSEAQKTAKHSNEQAQERKSNLLQQKISITQTKNYTSKQ